MNDENDKNVLKEDGCGSGRSERWRCKCQVSRVKGLIYRPDFLRHVMLCYRTGPVLELKETKQKHLSKPKVHLD